MNYALLLYVMSNVVEKTRYMEVSLKYHTREKCLSITCPVEENVSCVFHAVTGSLQGIFFSYEVEWFIVL